MRSYSHWRFDMRCITLDDARVRLRHLLDPNGKPLRAYPAVPALRFSYGHSPIPSFPSTVTAIVESVGPWEEAWLWHDRVDTWNRPALSAYYRVRQAHRDYQLVDEAPVHAFYRHEYHDLLTCVLLTILNEWSAFLVTSHDYGRAFLSSSHWLDVARSEASELQAVRQVLAAKGFEETPHPT